MGPWNCIMIDGSSYHQINLGNVYIIIKPLFAYCRNVVSLIGDPDIGIVGIIDHT